MNSLSIHSDDICSLSNYFCLLLYRHVFLSNQPERIRATIQKSFIPTAEFISLQNTVIVILSDDAYNADENKYLLGVVM